MQLSTKAGRRARVATILLAALAIAACGEREEPELEGEAAEQPASEVPGGADPERVDVIEEWSTTLREGDVAGAARYFAIPSIAQNGPEIRIRDRRDARLFNASLPCGARLVEATPRGDLVVATFELTERPGPGTCGSGTGEEARTAFAIEDGEIVEWRRVATAAPGNPV